jgi:hypothetical protein
LLLRLSTTDVNCRGSLIVSLSRLL